MGVGLEDMTSARITDSVGNVLPENTDGHIQLLSKGRALTYTRKMHGSRKMFMAIGGIAEITVLWISMATYF